MRKVLAILLLGFLGISYGNAQELKWYSWNEGYELAKQENKKMMVFVQADWCNWCKRMEDKTYNNDDVLPNINSNFIAIKFNIEQEGVLSYNGKEYSPSELLSKLSDNQCNGIPATIFVDSKTNRTALEMGFKTPEDFLLIVSKYSKKI